MMRARLLPGPASRGERRTILVVLGHRFRERARLRDQQLRYWAQHAVLESNNADGATISAQFDRQNFERHSFQLNVQHHYWNELRKCPFAARKMRP
jgi:hypothetical protein